MHTFKIGDRVSTHPVATPADDETDVGTVVGITPAWTVRLRVRWDIAEATYDEYPADLHLLTGAEYEERRAELLSNAAEAAGCRDHA